MPINLNREAQVEWDKYLEASSIDDQIFHLERFLGVCVKHKGKALIFVANESRRYVN